MKKPWTTREEAILRQLCPHFTVMQLTEKLGRNKYSITNKLICLGLTALPDHKTWTSREVKILESMVSDFTYDEIATELARSSASVRAYVQRNIVVKPRRFVWNPTPAQIQRVFELRQMNYSRPRIARTMRCTLANVRKVIKDYSDGAPGDVLSD